MNDKKTPARNRRSALKNVSGILLGMLSTSAVASSPGSGYKDKKSESRIPASNDPRELIDMAREQFGLDAGAKITGDIVDGRMIIGDELVLGTDPEGIDLLGQQVRDQLHRLIIRLLQTNRYEHETQVTMKFVLRTMQDELAFVVESLQSDSMAPEAARMKLRTSVTNFLDQLEQLPAV